MLTIQCCVAGQEAGADVDEAHDLTADEDRAEDAAQPSSMAEKRPHADDAAAAEQKRAWDVIKSVQRTLSTGPSGEDSEPAAAYNATGASKNLDRALVFRRGSRHVSSVINHQRKWQQLSKCVPCCTSSDRHIAHRTVLCGSTNVSQICNFPI